MFEACEGCGGMPDHKINGPVCVQIRAERVRAAQLKADTIDHAVKEAEQLRQANLRQSYNPDPPMVD